MKTKIYGLCFRCEYRAVWHETKQGPRAECHDAPNSVGSCYMYRPVLPYVTTKDSTDRRPRFAGAMLSARERVKRAVEVNDMILIGNQSGKEVFLYWVPKKKKRKPRL